MWEEVQFLGSMIHLFDTGPVGNAGEQSIYTLEHRKIFNQISIKKEVILEVQEMYGVGFYDGTMHSTLLRG